MPVHVSIYSITIVVVAAKGGEEGGVGGQGVGGAVKHKAPSAEHFRARHCALRAYSSYLST